MSAARSRCRRRPAGPGPGGPPRPPRCRLRHPSLDQVACPAPDSSRAIVSSANRDHSWFESAPRHRAQRVVDRPRRGRRPFNDSRSGRNDRSWGASSPSDAVRMPRPSAAGPSAPSRRGPRLARSSASRASGEQVFELRRHHRPLRRPRVPRPGSVQRRSAAAPIRSRSRRSTSRPPPGPASGRSSGSPDRLGDPGVPRSHGGDEHAQPRHQLLLG